jgi:hypothetical protein
MAVTAEAAGSSPVVPAIHSKRVCTDLVEAIEAAKKGAFRALFVFLLTSQSNLLGRICASELLCGGNALSCQASWG